MTDRRRVVITGLGVATPIGIGMEPFWDALLNRQCGVRRNGPGLRDALEAVDQWRRYVLARQFADIEGWELQNMLTLARVMIQAALVREESRGVHLRTDFPQLDDASWQKHVWFERSSASGAEQSGAA